jgi:hypothetical protein
MRGPAAQFVDRELEPGQRPNAGDERELVDRLGQEVVGAGFEAAHAVGGPIERGYENDRQVGGLGAGP